MVEIPTSAYTDRTWPTVGSELAVDGKRVGSITSLTAGEPLIALAYIRGDADLRSGLNVVTGTT